LSICMPHEIRKTPGTLVEVVLPLPLRAPCLVDGILVYSDVLPSDFEPFYIVRTAEAQSCRVTDGSSSDGCTTGWFAIRRHVLVFQPHRYDLSDLSKQSRTITHSSFY
jgi:hypothetical protein